MLSVLVTSSDVNDKWSMYVEGSILTTMKEAVLEVSNTVLLPLLYILLLLCSLVRFSLPRPKLIDQCH